MNSMNSLTNKVNYAEIIKSFVSVPAAVERYTAQKIVHNRICCPIHNGTDRNMRIYPKSYYCWVCHATGDVIQFVQSVQGVSFQDAIRELDRDFHLNLFRNADRSNLERLDKERSKQIVRDALDRIERFCEDERRANLEDILFEVELICNELAPKTPDDEWREDWCAAMRLKTVLEAELL